MSTSKASVSASSESIPADEAAQIAAVVDLTDKQLQHRYATKLPFLRGVHAKDHGCVEATFSVGMDIPPEYRVGLFAQPGRQFPATIRFSNAAPLVRPDSLLRDNPGAPGAKLIEHGSRGMAVKVHGVGGARLVRDSEDTQDFLMINQPVFAFANAEDYKALSEAIVLSQPIDPEETPTSFFARLKSPDPKIRARTAATAGIIGCIKSNSVPPLPPPHAFQPPPLSPLDNRYFSAAPFSFGEGWVAKFGAKPVAPASGDLGNAVSDKDYLRTALNKRLTADQIVFEFQVQRRSVETLDIENDIENACTLWDESTHPFVTVATITIPPQDINAPTRVAACEALAFSPWHGLAEHRPLGSINRLRRAVYEKSAALRGCPVVPPSHDPDGGLSGDAIPEPSSPS